MKKAKDDSIERRKYVRLQTPIDVSYVVPETGKILNTNTKNISADGMRFETNNKSIKESDLLELKMVIQDAPNPVHARARIVWKRKISLDDAAPYDCGLEFTEIEEDNKNTFLKFLCDLIYNIKKEPKNAKKR